MMNKPTNTTMSSTLFTIRLWHEDHSEDEPEWRGKITNLYNREVRYFRDPETLYGVMLKMVKRLESARQMTVTSDRSGGQDHQPRNNARK